MANIATLADEQSDVEVVIHLRDDGNVRVERRGAATSPAITVLADELQEIAELLVHRLVALEQDGRLRRRLSPKRARSVSRALSHLTGVLVTSAWDERVTTDDLGSRTQVTTDTVDVVLEGDSTQLAGLIRGLPAAVATREDRRDREDGGAAARGNLRLHALYRKLIRDSFTVRELALRRLSRQRLQQLRGAGQLFAVEVPFHKGLLHPRWQFDANGRPRPEMPDLIEAARAAGLDAIAFHQLMLSTSGDDDCPPLDLLDMGQVEEVLEIVRAGGL